VRSHGVTPPATVTMPEGRLPFSVRRDGASPQSYDPRPSPLLGDADPAAVGLSVRYARLVTPQDWVHPALGTEAYRTLATLGARVLGRKLTSPT
jgi:hypothetical protein